MNAILQARQAYAPGYGPARSPRSVELQLFGEITSRLRRASDCGSFAQMAAALHENRRLWMRLAADVADSGNGLSAELRAQILYLAEFTNRHSRCVLRESADPSILIEINMAVMHGLDGQAANPVPS